MWKSTNGRKTKPGRHSGATFSVKISELVSVSKLNHYTGFGFSTKRSLQIFQSIGACTENLKVLMSFTGLQKDIHLVTQSLYKIKKGYWCVRARIKRKSAVLWIRIGFNAEWTQHKERQSYKPQAEASSFPKRTSSTSKRGISSPFFCFCVLILTSWIRIRVRNADPDLANTKINADLNPQHCILVTR